MNSHKITTEFQAIMRLKESYMLFSSLPEKFKNDKKFVLKAIDIFKSNHLEILKYTSKEIQDDEPIVKKIIEKDPFALQYTSPRLKNNLEIVMLAVEKDGAALLYASRKMRENKKVALIAVKTSVHGLNYTSEKIINDKDVVLASVGSSGYSLLYASEKLRDDKEVALAAVKSNGEALSYTSVRLRNDKEVVFEAIKNGSRNFLHVGNELKVEIGDREPLKYLESVLLKEGLTKELTQSPKNDVKSKKIKV